MHCSLLHHGVVPTAKASEHKHWSVKLAQHDLLKQPVLAFQTHNRPGKEWQRTAKGHWSIESCIQRVLLQHVLERVTRIVKPVPRDRSPGELWAAMAFKRGHTAQHLCHSCKCQFFACFINLFTDVHCSLLPSSLFPLHASKNVPATWEVKRFDVWSHEKCTSLSSSLEPHKKISTSHIQHHMQKQN